MNAAKLKIKKNDKKVLNVRISIWYKYTANFMSLFISNANMTLTCDHTCIPCKSQDVKSYVVADSTEKILLDDSIEPYFSERVEKAVMRM